MPALSRLAKEREREILSLTPSSQNTPPAESTAKTERLRQAKAEAEKEIAAYRAEREAAYQKRLAEVRLCFVASCARALDAVTPPTTPPTPLPLPDKLKNPPSPQNTTPNQSSSGAAEMEERMRVETEQQVAKLRADVAAKKASVVEMLAARVTTAPLPAAAK